MPPQSRAQRRRQAARQQGRATSAPSAGAVSRTPSTGSTIPLAPTESASTRTVRPARRVISRPAAEPVDYSKDYIAVRRDLRWIALWTVLLFVVMIALRLFVLA